MQGVGSHNAGSLENGRLGEKKAGGLPDAERWTGFQADSGPDLGLELSGNAVSRKHWFWCTFQS